MDLNRREFLILSAAVAAGCDQRTAEMVPATPPSSAPTTTSDVSENVIDAGVVAQFTEDRVYDDFREQGFFVIRRERKLFVLSAVCTHKGCKVRAQSDGSFACRCHGSTFDRDGRVTKGPAPRDLPRLAVKESSDAHLLVNLRRPIPQST